MSDIIEKLIPLVYALAGASMTYFFWWRQEDLKRASEARVLAAALQAELSCAQGSLRHRLNALRSMQQSKQDGGTVLRVSEIGELYKSHVSRIGLLGAETATKVILVYKVLGSIPPVMRLTAGYSGPEWPDSTDFECAHDDPALRNMLLELVKVDAQISATIQALAKINSPRTAISISQFFRAKRT